MRNQVKDYEVTRPAKRSTFGPQPPSYGFELSRQVVILSTNGLSQPFTKENYPHFYSVHTLPGRNIGFHYITVPYKTGELDLNGNHVMDCFVLLREFWCGDNIYY